MRQINKVERQEIVNSQNLFNKVEPQNANTMYRRTESNTRGKKGGDFQSQGIKNRSFHAYGEEKSRGSDGRQPGSIKAVIGYGQENSNLPAISRIDETTDDGGSKFSQRRDDEDLQVEISPIPIGKPTGPQWKNADQTNPRRIVMGDVGGGKVRMINRAEISKAQQKESFDRGGQ